MILIVAFTLDLALPFMFIQASYPFVSSTHSIYISLPILFILPGILASLGLLMCITVSPHTATLYSDMLIKRK